MFDMVTLPCTGCTTVITFIIIFHQNIYLGKSFPLLSINIQYIISESVQINTKSILINITFLSRKFDSQQLQQEKCIRNAKQAVKQHAFIFACQPIFLDNKQRYIPWMYMCCTTMNDNKDAIPHEGYDAYDIAELMMMMMMVILQYNL